MSCQFDLNDLSLTSWYHPNLEGLADWYCNRENICSFPQDGL